MVLFPNTFLSLSLSRQKLTAKLFRWKEREKEINKKDVPCSTYQTVTRQILIYCSDSSPIKVANEGNSRETESIFGRNDPKKVGIILDGVNGICIRI